MYFVVFINLIRIGDLSIQKDDYLKCDFESSNQTNYLIRNYFITELKMIRTDKN